MAALNPDHLLDQADRLVGPPGGGAPRQADLKRAISNAYYAVFHAISTGVADEFAGKTKRQSPMYALVYRSVDHRSLLKLCNTVIKLPSKYSKYAPRKGFDADLIALAAAVIELQEKRHSADYDPLFSANLTDATLAVATARSALDRFRNANRTHRKAFVTLVVFSPR